jgi:abhydrolase domain-containing protein 17
MASFLLVLGTRLQCNIVSYDYSGYGISQGKASEKNMYADIEATYKSIKQRYQISESKIILYGQSIGERTRSLSRMIFIDMHSSRYGADH